MNLAEATALEVAALVRRGEASARDVALAVIDRVERLNPLLNALPGFDAEAVLAEADRLDATPRSGAGGNTLVGTFVSVKDNLWVEGRRASQGSRLFADFVAPRSALAVERARATGAVVLGRSNCSEFACKGVTTNPLFGATRNPRDVQRTPGGSSGGAAAAVAAGLGHWALCTDGGGSTRRPASHTGVVGFKPSAGAIAHPVGFAEPVFGNSVIGLMARCVDDVAAAFGALAGPDPRDPACTGPPTVTPPASWTGTRIAYSPSLGLDVPVDSEVQAAVEAAAAHLRDAGAEVLRADPPWPGGSSEEALMPLQWAGLAALYGDAWRRDPRPFDPDIAAQIERGLSTRGADVARALWHRDAMFQALAGFFAEHPLLIGPTTPCVAWPLDRLGPEHIAGRAVGPRAHAAFTPAWNHVYAPACSVPVALDRQGLPIGAQVVGWRGHDLRVLQAARELQARAPAHFRRPVTPTPPPLGPTAA